MISLESLHWVTYILQILSASIKKEFRRLGVTHIKIKVPGKDIPGDDIFAQLVKCSFFS